MAKEPKDDDFQKMDEAGKASEKPEESSSAVDKAIDTEGIELTQFDREKYLYFEPVGIVDKFKSLVNNTMEVLYVIAIASLALVYNSVIACAFFLLSYIVLYSSVQKLSSRIFGGFVSIGIILVSLLGVVIAKWNDLGKMVSPSKNY